MRTVAEVHPNPARVSLTSSNLKNAEKQVVLTIDGERYTLSPKLTELFRTKKIGVEDLGEYFVRDVEGTDGTTFKSIGMPSDDITIKVSGWRTTKVGSKEVTIDQLMELVAF